MLFPVHQVPAVLPFYKRQGITRGPLDMNSADLVRANHGRQWPGCGFGLQSGFEVGQQCQDDDDGNQRQVEQIACAHASGVGGVAR